MVSHLSDNPSLTKKTRSSLLKAIEEIVYSVELRDDQTEAVFSAPDISVQVLDDINN